MITPVVRRRRPREGSEAAIGAEIERKGVPELEHDWLDLRHDD